MSYRVVVWALAFSLGLNIVLIGMVSTHLSRGGWTAPQAVAAPRSSPATHVLQFDEKRLKLTAQQSEQFREIRDRYWDEEKKAKAQGVERIQKISKSLVQDNATTQSLQPVFSEIRKHSDGFFVRLTCALQEYRAVLDAEQRVVFNQMLQERFNSLQRFTRQRTYEYEQRISQVKQRERKGEKKAGEKKSGEKRTGGKNEKKADGRKAEPQASKKAPQANVSGAPKPAKPAQTPQAKP